MASNRVRMRSAAAQLPLLDAQAGAFWFQLGVEQAPTSVKCASWAPGSWRSRSRRWLHFADHPAQWARGMLGRNVAVRCRPPPRGSCAGWPAAARGGRFARREAITRGVVEHGSRSRKTGWVHLAVAPSHLRSGPSARRGTGRMCMPKRRQPRKLHRQPGSSHHHRVAGAQRGAAPRCRARGWPHGGDDVLGHGVHIGAWTASW